MKYFTKELYLKTCSDDKKIAQASRKLWRKHEESYWNLYLDRIRSSIPEKLHKFLRKESLHDGVPLNYIFGDFLDNEDRWQRKKKHYVQIKVLHPQGEYIYVLEFAEIRKSVFNYPSDNPLFDKYNQWKPDEWAFEEITLRRDNWIRFELWLFSGATILLEFKYFTYKKIKATSHSLPMQWARK